MDLSPTPFLPADAAEAPADWPALVALARVRQEASPTALAQARLPAPRARFGGAFAAPVAAGLARGAGRGGQERARGWAQGRGVGQGPAPGRGSRSE